LLVSLISDAGSSIPYVGVVASLILTGPMQYGLAATTLACARGEKWDIEKTFCGFKENFSGNIVLGLLYFVFIFLWMLLLIIPGIIKSYSYAMAFYIAKDRPNLGASDCLKESARIMNGNKMQLFCLDLSFIGWYLLGALCLGVGTLFVAPYHQMARANFYAELVGRTTYAEEEFVNPEDYSLE